MEIVRNSDIAQLVLGYLKDQNLDKAAWEFCKSSPYLQEEYSLLKKGLRPITLGSCTLIDIIKENCQIKSKVSQIIDDLPNNDRERALKQNTLTEKLSFVFKKLLKDKCLEKQDGSNRRQLKRTRSIDSVNSIDTIQISNAKSSLSKRLKTSESYFFLSSNSTMIDSASEYDDEQLSSDNEINPITKQPNESKKNDVLSTDLKKSSLAPALSETILKKTDFQNVLVENINKALQVSHHTNSDISNNFSTPKEQNNEQNNNCTQDILNEQFDEMIKKILDETERDPAFNEIVQEAVFLRNSAKKVNLSTRSTQVSPILQMEQCNSKPSEKISKSIQVSSEKEKDTTKVQNNISEEQKRQAANANACDVKDTSNTEVNSESKFIIFNESLGSLGNNTFMTCSNLSNIQGLNGNEQVLIELSSGQLSFPIVMSAENMPLIVNNELISQQFEQNEPAICNLNKQIQNESTSAFNSSSSLLQKDLAQAESIPQIPTDSQQKTNLNNKIFDSFILEKEKQTPRENINKISTIRSLSTPRRRASHVRILNFDNDNPGPSSKQKLQQNTNVCLDPAPETRPQLFSVEDIASNCTIGNESSSNSLDFGIEESNQTVIHREISDTPKRKTNAHKCVRLLSRSNSEEDHDKVNKLKTAKKSKLKNSKKMKQNLKKESTKVINSADSNIDLDNNEHLSPLEAWNKMRATFSTQNWDQHLRLLEAKSSSKKAILTKKIKKKSPKNRKRKFKMSKPKNNSSEGIINENDKSQPSKTKSKKNSIDDKLSSKSETSAKISSSRSSCRKTMKFKIPTPLKSTKILFKDHDKLNEKENAEVKSTNIKESEDSSNNKGSENNNIKPGICIQNLTLDETRLKRRTDNISLLLDTPFKRDGTEIPKTPRFVDPGLEDTPITKLMKTFQCPLTNHKLLDIATPNIAITPGAGLTIINEKETPTSISDVFSNRPTDYSSGGSYYKPDESEDLDRHLDRILSAERKKLMKVDTFKETTSLQNEKLLFEVNCDEYNKSTTVLSEHQSTIEETKNQIDNENQENYSSLHCSNSKKIIISGALTRKRSNMSLSEIDSSEDESWNKISTENLQKDVEVVTSKQKKQKIQSLEEKKRARQLRELEQKKVRMKEKLRIDFFTNVPVKKPITIKLNKSAIQKAMKIKSNTNVSCTKSTKIHFDSAVTEHSSSCTPIPSMDVLAALNLSAKKKENTSEIVKMPIAYNSNNENRGYHILKHQDDNAVTKDLFLNFNEHTEDKTRTEDDSRESAESVKVRNAAMALTTFQKNFASQINYEKLETLKKQEDLIENKISLINKKKKPGNDKVQISKNIIIETKINPEIKRKQIPRRAKLTPKKPLATVPKLHQTRAASQIMQTRSSMKPKTKTSPKIELKNSPNTPKKIANKNSKSKNIKEKPTPKKNEKKMFDFDSATKQPEVIIDKLIDNKQLNPNQKSSNFINENLSQPNDITTKEFQAIEVRSVIENPFKKFSKILEMSDEPEENEEFNKLVTEQQKDKTSKEIMNTDNKDDIEDVHSSEEEDPYDECDVTTIDENDSKRYFHINYTGSKIPELKENIYQDSIQSSLKIFIDNVPHIIQVTDEIELFSKKSKSLKHLEHKKVVKNIPKKREKNAHVSYCNEIKQTQTKKVSASLLNDKNNDEEAPKKNDIFHTSTPCRPKFILHYSNQHNTEKDTKEKIQTKNSGNTNSSNKRQRKSSMLAIKNNEVDVIDGTPISDDQAKTLRQEDIYAVLSHLHGTDLI